MRQRIRLLAPAIVAIALVVPAAAHAEHDVMSEYEMAELNAQFNMSYLGLQQQMQEPTRELAEEGLQEVLREHRETVRHAIEGIG